MSVQSRTVTLVSGGTITLEVDADLFTVTAGDFALIRSLVASIDSYELGRPEPTPDLEPTPVAVADPVPVVEPAAPLADGRKMKLTDEVIAKVALVANEAITGCRDPGSAVAAALGIKAISASAYMAEARRRGHTIPVERPCLHCGRPFALRGVATHERTCNARYPVTVPAASTPSPEVAKPEVAQVSTPTPARSTGHKLADEIAALRARDRAERDAKGRSAITDAGDDEDEPRVVWSCHDCPATFGRKLLLQRHVSEHGRVDLHAHEEIGAIA